MAAISIEEKPSLNLMILRLSGQLSPEALGEAQKRFYAERKAIHAILDLRGCSLDLFSLDDFKQALSFSRSAGDFRRGGVTVFVTDSPLQLAVARLYQAYAETTPNFPVRVEIAASSAEAEALVRAAGA